MKNGQVIPYTCHYLGNFIFSHDDNARIDNVLADMSNRLTNLLVEYSNCNSSTLSTLCKTYCMNMDVKRVDIFINMLIHFTLHGPAFWLNVSNNSRDWKIPL